MFIRQLHYLIALAKYHHFSQAAESCWVSQPTLSVAIRQLERELGITIIKRDHRFQAFTPEGKRVLNWARQTLTSLDGLRQEAALARAEACGHLAIGAVPSASRAVSLLTSEYRHAIPKLTLKVYSLCTHDILERLKKHDIHLGIAYSEQCPDGLFETMPLYTERFVLLSGASAAIPHTALSWAEIGQLPLCLFHHEMQNRRIVEDAFHQAGIIPDQIVIETNTLSVIYEMVRSGEACSVAPISAVPDYFITNGIVVHPIVPQPSPEMCLLRLRQKSQPAVLESVWAMSSGIDLQHELDQAIISVPA